MISILHVTQSAGYGVAHYLEDLVADQAARGWRVALATPPSVPLEERCRALGVDHVLWDAQRSITGNVVPESARFRRVLRAAAPDVVHLHSSKAGLVGRLTMRGRRPTIFSPHAWSFLHEGPMMQRAALTWERWGARWADVIVCGSAAERARGEASGIRALFETVPNAVDLERFRPVPPGGREAARAELGLAAGPLAVCVGRLVAQKGQDLLLEAWPAIRRRVPGASLVLVGDGELRPQVEERATAGVRLVGRTDDVRPWLAAADVVVQPSRWETLSLSVLEALARGRCVVAADVEGMREAIGDPAGDAAGAVVPVDDPGALAAAVADRLVDPALVAAEEARAAARAPRFGLRPWGDALAAITERVLAGRRADG